MTILCIDQGNTRTKTGLYTGEDRPDTAIHGSQKALLQYVRVVQPRHMIISSVQRRSKQLLHRLRRIAPVMVVDHALPLPVRIRYETPQTLGADRMAAVVGARALYPGQACLVIDAGTCITYDYIDREGSYHGGAISPGIDMRFRALHKYTASLPHVARGNRHNLIGTSTRTSMISGVVNGTVREIEGVIRSYHNIDAGIRVILCGGDAIFFEKKLKGSIFAIPDLVITGLYKIFRFNDLPVHRL